MRLAAVALLLAACAPDFGYTQDDSLRLNHVQMKGTHNSYHLRMDKPVDPSLDYSHAKLTEQLEKQGVRQFELDAHLDTDTGRFTVFHIPGIDDRSTCHWFKDCVTEIATWSAAHPGHHPLVLLVEPKDDVDASNAQIPPALDDLDAEVRAAWPAERLLTPDDVKGTHATLAEAVTTDGWPTLGALRGKALFVFNDPERAPGKNHYEYTHGLKDLAGRAMFVVSEETDPYAAVMSLEAPIEDAERIKKAAEKGFLIRTMLGEHGGDEKAKAERAAALAGYAHMISTDYPAPATPGGYSVELGGTPSRCHPLAPKTCTNADIEAPDRLVAK